MTDENNNKTPGVDVITSSPLPIKLSTQAIMVVKENIKLCEFMVHDVLEKEIDYGSVPGVAQEFLYDSGAAKIMAAFNCYPRYTVLRATEEEGINSITMESSLISRQSRQVIATGVGACSTRETKYKYRWVVDPEEWGVPKKGLKTRRDGRFQIPNPELGELVNTMTKMAAKRADIDAVQSLPGVAGALRKLFTDKGSLPPKTPPKKEPKETPAVPQASFGPGV